MGAVVVLAATPWAPVRAQVLTSITIDGDMSDWSAVLADPFQNAFDGPSGGLTDLDAPVPSTGRDLLSFAWTYDATYLYLHVSRVASSSNVQRFWFYVDVDEDGLLTTGDPVVAVSWWGTNRKTVVDLYAYTAASPAGDPLGDPTGTADGWTMPGTVLRIAQLEHARGGASSGVEMEARVSWADLGIPPETPVRFHVSSSNSTNVPQQIHDNMGGPGGAIGTTRFGGVRISPASVKADAVPGSSAPLAHVVENLGTSADRIAFAWTAVGSWSPTAVAFHLDVDGDGRVGPTDVAIVDTDGDGLADHGPVAGGASFAVVVSVTVPSSAADGDSAAIEVTASSVSVPGASDVAFDEVTVRIPAITLVKSVDASDAAPGQVLTYTVDYTSSGTVDAHAVVVVDPLPAEVEYLAGTAVGPGTVIEFSHDGGATFDASEDPPVTHIRWRLTSPLAPGDSGTVSFRSRVR